MRSDQNVFYYLISVQFLGYRYHGWAKQGPLKTVQGQLEKTLRYVLGEVKFKTLGAGRTDAMVSAEQTYFELFVWEALDIAQFTEIFNDNLPQDIRVLEITPLDKKINIIQDAKIKTYHYLFTCNHKMHPFAAPLMANFKEDLDIERMQKGATEFEGTHDFRNFCYKFKEEIDPVRSIHHCSISKNTQYSASFFPEHSYLFKIQGEGFMRYQIRLMMGALVRLGKKEIDLKTLIQSLQPNPIPLVQFVAPSSGLLVHSVSMENTKK